MTKEYSMLVSCFITFRDLLEADDMYISSERAYFSSFHHPREAAAFLFFRLLCSSSGVREWSQSRSCNAFVVVRESREERNWEKLRWKSSLFDARASLLYYLPYDASKLITSDMMNMELTYENDMCDAPLIGLRIFKKMLWYAKNFICERLRNCELISWKFLAIS